MEVMDKCSSDTIDSTIMLEFGDTTLKCESNDFNFTDTADEPKNAFN